MAVRAKFYVAEVTQYASGSSRPGYSDPAPIGRVVMRPATRGTQNADWASATPSGEFTMTVNGPAFPWFQERIGKDISILLDDAPDEE